MKRLGVRIDSRSPSAVVLRRSILFPHSMTGTLSLILAIRGSQTAFSRLMMSKLFTSYTKIITCAFSISLSVFYSSVLLSVESTNTVALLFGNRYRSGEIVTVSNRFLTSLGKVSVTIVWIIDVFPTPSEA